MTATIYGNHQSYIQHYLNPHDEHSPIQSFVCYYQTLKNHIKPMCVICYLDFDEDKFDAEPKRPCYTHTTLQF